MSLKVAAKAILMHDGKVLIVSAGELWDFPGGGIKDGETLPQALKRELHEELGLSEVVVGGVVHVDEWFISRADDTLHVVGVFFRCELDHQPEIRLSDEHTHMAWILPEELPNYNATPDTIRALEAYLR